MRKLIIIVAVALLITLSGCSEGSDNKPNFNVVRSNVTVWEDSAGKYNIILAFEASNSRNSPLYFKKSDFDIVDENGTLIDTMQSVSAYPPVVDHNETAVYYDAKISDKISDTNIKLKAIPHIESEKSHTKQAQLSIQGITREGRSIVAGIIKNISSQTEYNNVHVAIIFRTQSDEVFSVMTATIDSIKPGELTEFEAEDPAVDRDLGPGIVISKRQNFAYIDPEEGESKYTIKDLVYLVFLLLFFGGVICLQIFLSKKNKKWIGWILPSISFAYSLIYTVYIFLLFQKIGFMHAILITFVVFLICNILTLILMAIYWVCQKKRKRQEETQ